MPIAPYAKVTLDVCDDRGTPYEVDFEDIELLHEDTSVPCVDWDAFRREAAKDVLPAIIAKKSSMCGYDEVVREAILFTDELIKQLRNGKE